MSGFSPEAIYERGRQKVTANQPRFYELFRQILGQGLALCIENPGGDHWLALAPWSRLEPRLLLAYDLAVEGEAGLRRIEFEEINFFHDSDETAGWFLVKGNPVAEFRPLPDAEDEVLINHWNARSGRTPIQYVAP